MRDKEDEVILERRLTTLEMNVDKILGILEKREAKKQWWAAAVIALAAAWGVPYIEEHAFNNKGSVTVDAPAVVDGLRDDS